jgi:Tol biopolymer transport system component
VDHILSLSPCGGKILFTNSIFGDSEIASSKLYVADSDGKNQKTIFETSDSLIDQAAWNQMGDKIAFKVNDALYTINPDGSGKTTVALTAYQYSWHPSGSYLTFISPIGENKNTQVLMAKSDGTGRVQISPDNQSRYLLGDWSPDGSRLLFRTGLNTLLVAKFGGYKEVMSLYAPGYIEEGQDFVIQVKSMSEPVKNAVLTLDGRKIGTTNETGYLMYDIKKPGNYLLNATKEGYQLTSRSIAVQDNSRIFKQGNMTNTTTPLDTDKIPGFSFILLLIALNVLYLLWRI